MFYAEHAYRLNVISPTVHRYTYTDAESQKQSSLISPIGDSALLTALSTGYNGIVWGEFTDSRASYDSVRYELTDGTVVEWTQQAWYGGTEWKAYRNGVLQNYTSYNGEKIKFCVRTDTIWKTSYGYAAGGRMFFRLYHPSLGWHNESETLQDCKLDAQIYQQIEKRHVITQSG